MIEKPEWDVESPKGRREMAAWLDYMLDRDLDVRFEKMQDEAHSSEIIEEALAFGRDNDGISYLRQRLNDGTASERDLKRAARLLDPSPKKRGRKAKGTSGRDWRLVAAAQDHERIKLLWKVHYGKTYSVNEKSAEFAEQRWNTIKWVAENARRSKDRKFAAD